MKLSILSVPAIVIISFVLCGCPVSSDFPLAERSAALPIDNTLIGTWRTSADSSEAKEVKIEKYDEPRTYKVIVTEKGETFMADQDMFTGWLVSLNNMRFLVLQEMHTVPKDVYFVYHISGSENKMTTHDISLQVKGTDAITSVKSYQEEVLASMGKEGFLRNKIDWTRK